VLGHQVSSFASPLVHLTRCTYLQQYYIKGRVFWTFTSLILWLCNLYNESNQNNVFTFEIFCKKCPRICFVVLQLPVVTVCAVSIFVTALWSVAVIWWILSLRLICHQRHVRSVCILATCVSKSVDALLLQWYRIRQLGLVIFRLISVGLFGKRVIATKITPQLH